MGHRISEESSRLASCANCHGDSRLWKEFQVGRRETMGIVAWDTRKSQDSHWE